MFVAWGYVVVSVKNDFCFRGGVCAIDGARMCRPTPGCRTPMLSGLATAFTPPLAATADVLNIPFRPDIESLKER